MNSRTILILTASHLSRNPRVVKEATTLAQSGYAVTVLNVAQIPAAEEMDRAMTAGMPFTRTTLDLLGTTARSRVARLLARASTRLARTLLCRLQIESATALGPALPLLRAALRTPADLTIVHNEIPLWIGRRLIAEGRRVAVDMEDWHSEDLMPEDRRSRPLRLLRDTERAMLNEAEFATTTSDAMADAFVEAYGCPRPIPVRNTFPLPERSTVDRASNGPVSFYWFSQTVGPGRGLEEFISAWRMMKTPTLLRLRGNIRPAFCEELVSALSAEQRARVSFLPLVSPSELVDDMPYHDIGLALEPRTPRNRDLTVTNKLFQYMEAGLAVVATDTAGQSQILRAAPGAGILIRSGLGGGLASVLDDLASHPQRLRECQRAARRAAETDFRWEMDSRRLLNCVAAAFDRMSPSQSPVAPG